MSCGCNTGLTIPTSPPFPAFPPPVGDGVTPGTGVVVDACAGINPAPTVQNDFTTPAIGAQGQFYTACAYVWALPGVDILIPPFGRVSVTAVNDNIISYINRTIPASTTIIAGTPMVVASGWDFVAAPSGDAVEYLLGTIGGYPRLIAGTPGMVMKRITDTDLVTRWKPIATAAAGYSYYPLSTPVEVLTATAAGTHSATLTGHPGAGVPCVPALAIDFRITCNNTGRFNRKVLLNGYDVWALGGYFFTSYSYEWHQQAALPGYGLCMAGNPVTFTVTDENVADYTIDTFKVILAGWYY